MSLLNPCRHHSHLPFLLHRSPPTQLRQARVLSQRGTGSCGFLVDVQRTMLGLLSISMNFRDSVSCSYAEKKASARRNLVRASQGEQQQSERRTFLSLEEAGLVEISGLSTHEKFLCRLTISSLNLLRVISEQEGVAIEELNAGLICDWFLKDKLKREQNIESAVLQWDDSGFQM